MTDTYYNGTRARIGEGYVDNVTAGFSPETDYILQRTPYGAQTVPPPLVFVHGAGGHIDGMLGGDQANIPGGYPYMSALIWQLAHYFTVIATDMGGDGWGNMTHQGYIERARLYLNSQMGCSGPVTLVGVSMGGGASLAYARNPSYASNVRAVCGIIPVISLAALKTIFTSSVNAAYGGNYTDAAYGANHSPIIFGNASTMTSTPVKLFYSSTDTTTLPADQATYVASRPQTMEQMVGTNGHGDLSVYDATPSAIDFCRFLR